MFQKLVVNFQPRMKELGLFGGIRIGSGNKVTEKYESKTRRKFFPNVQRVHLFSEKLNERIEIFTVPQVLKRIDAMGGLDNYLLKSSDQELDGKLGEALRARLLFQGDQLKAELKKIDQKFPKWSLKPTGRWKNLEMARVQRYNAVEGRNWYFEIARLRTQARLKFEATLKNFRDKQVQL